MRHNHTFLRRPQRRRRRPDVGATFTEVLIAIVLMGFAVSVIIAGIRMTIQVSSVSDDQANVEAVLTAAADRLTTTDYITCPDSASSDYHAEVSAAAASVGWDTGQIRIVDIDYWDPMMNQAGSPDIVPADGGWAETNTIDGSGCDDSAVFTTSRTLQRIVIEATSPDGSFVRTLEVVKANICADTDSTKCRTATGGTP